jgi:hypothetical protein
MELSYSDVLSDLAHYRALGADEHSLARTEGIINHCFVMMNKFSELELAHQNLRAQVISYQEIIFGQSKAAQDNGQDDSALAEQAKDANNKTESDHTEPNNVASDDSGSGSASTNDKEPLGDNHTDQGESASSKKLKSTPKGHGRLGADAYTGANVERCNHHSHRAGDVCPECQRGKLYVVDPNKKVVIDGQSPFLATVYLLEVLRCALCGFLMHAQAPRDVRSKYTAATKAVLAYLHYGMGLTYYGIERMQLTQGVPIPQSTQSELVAQAAGPVFAITNHLQSVARESDLIIQDDTVARIIELIQVNRTENPKRKGMYTTAFVVKTEHPFVLYISGRQHAGENFDDLMSGRLSQTTPVRVADALKANSDHQAPAEQGKCNAHAFRKFRTLMSLFPEHSSLAMEIYGQVYDNDTHCQSENYTPEQRLAYHQLHSGPLMNDLFSWARAQLNERKVEPNGALGKLLGYLLNHEKELTLFLRKAGVPIDSNEVERLLKEMIRYRKRSLFFGTCYSACYASAYMSVIATCHMHQVDAIDYLTQLQINEHRVWQDPGRWLPWNYRDQNPMAQAA